jgi:putative transcriptional regulator
MTDQKRLTPCHLAWWFRHDLRLVVTASLLALATLIGAAVAVTEPPAAGSKSFFLVASRDMPDPVFQQSVILMLPPEEPPLVAGVIINKPTKVTVANLLKEQVQPENRNQKVYFGGPVELTSPLLVVRTSRPPKGAIQLRNDAYAIDDPSAIAGILKNSRYGGDARLFLGRAQWAQEQLRGELLEGAWTVVPVRTDLIFEQDAAKVWRSLSQYEHVREIDAHCQGPGSPFSLTMCRGAFTR